MSFELGVSKKTVQNWEKGISSPSFFQSLEWFRALNINPFPYYLSYAFPAEFDCCANIQDEEEILEAFRTLIEQIPLASKIALLYIYHGEHGSSPNAVLQLMLAHLHTPIKSRVTQAVLIKNVYEMEKELDNLICPDKALPDMSILNKAIQRARLSAIQHDYGYCSLDCIE